MGYNVFKRKKIRVDKNGNYIEERKSDYVKTTNEHDWADEFGDEDESA